MDPCYGYGNDGSRYFSFREAKGAGMRFLTQQLPTNSSCWNPHWTLWARAPMWPGASNVICVNKETLRFN
jgi:hypothetical protein